jgi:hypothetical protein
MLIDLKKLFVTLPQTAFSRRKEVKPVYGLMQSGQREKTRRLNLAEALLKHALRDAGDRAEGLHVRFPGEQWWHGADLSCLQVGRDSNLFVGEVSGDWEVHGVSQVSCAKYSLSFELFPLL